MALDVLGGLELAVLVVLLDLGADAYSVPIVNELEKRTGKEVAAAAVYIALRRLEDKSLLRSELRPPGPSGGRERRHFILTEMGRERLRESHRIYTSLLAGFEPSS